MGYKSLYLLEVLMHFLIIFSALFISQNTASAQPMSCMEMFSKSKERSLQDTIDKNYYFNKNYSDLIHKLQQQGVRFQFWDPSRGGSVSLERLHTEPIIIAEHFDGKFIVDDITITLPINPSTLFGSEGSIYPLRKALTKVDRIIELQKSGVRFSSTSLLFGQSVSIVGFEPSAKLMDSTLVAIRHLFEKFRYKGVTFEPNEAVWDRYGFLPDSKIVQDPSDRQRLLLRSYYFERTDYWEQLTYDLDNNLFKPHGQSLLRPPDRALN